MGTTESVTISQPAAGSDWSIKPSTTDDWYLLSLVATLTTSATVATRYAHLRVLDQQGNKVADIPPSSGQAASLAYEYSWLRHAWSGAAAGSADDGSLFGPTPSMWLPPQWQVAVVTTAIAAADAWSNVQAIITYRQSHRMVHEVEDALAQILG